MDIHQLQNIQPIFRDEDNNSNSSIQRFEKIPTQIFESSNTASIAVAAEIAQLIREKARQGVPCVLGLATGSTPVSIYNELIRLHKEEQLSFKNVITFNLDEYHPMPAASLHSYRRFMEEHLFNEIDIPKENIHIPDGTVPKAEVYQFCQAYEKQINEAGGIDLQILGIGRTGHIGFNEPGSPINSQTRLITLDHLTRVDAASDFFGEENVPRTAITMGVGSILKAKRIILLAWGEAKSHIIKKAIEGPITQDVPTTYIQQHAHATIILDKAAAAELSREKTPWLVGNCIWNDRLVRKAVVWLCQKVNKPILKLTDRDYNDNGMSHLVANLGPANKINIKVFNDLQRTISGWPGGKPHADDSTRPERALPYPKRVLVFSPHPDDDAISMGGTLQRLVEQGHQVHTAYQTSGSIAVFDDDVIRYLDFVNEYSSIFQNSENNQSAIYDNIIHFLKNKQAGQVDSAQIQQIKAAIRRGEALAACRYMGIAQEQVHFLDLPFYETGTVKKRPLSEADIRIVTDILEKIQPHQIFVAGDLSDPHGTHRVCLNAILASIKEVQNQDWFKHCNIWLYRGAWQEWDLDQVDMAVPLSPDELGLKRKAIFKHQSQKDRPLFPGFDEREFWQRAEDRNRNTARLYDKLGMAEYEAIEVFVKYNA